MSIEQERELGWDDTIQQDGLDFILLPEGDYDFTVTDFKRERHNGSEKLPPCNKAVLTLTVKTADGDAYINHNLFLHSRTEGMVSSFFVGIGQKKHGEPLKMDWNKVRGSKGRAKIGVRTYENKQYNEVKRFYDPAKAAPAKGYTPGAF